MIKPEWHFMKNTKTKLCSCILEYENCCGAKQNTTTSTTSGDPDTINYTYNDKD